MLPSKSDSSKGCLCFSALGSFDATSSCGSMFENPARNSHCSDLIHVIRAKCWKMQEKPANHLI